MNIQSAVFLKGIIGEDDILHDGIPQVAFLGRSNVGKSSVLNTLAQTKGLAKSSSTPGRTQQINFFFVNKKFYLVDLPGYGYAKASHDIRDKIIQLIHWYVLEVHPKVQKIVLILDAKVGPTADDLKMLDLLGGQDKDVIVLANKIDKIKPSQLKKTLAGIQGSIGKHKLIPYSAEKKIGVGLLTAEIISVL